MDGALPPKTRVILDVDTGVDDAIAIVFAVMHPRIELVAVTCVNGNVDIDHVVENTLRVLEHVGASAVPVYKGMRTGVTRDRFPNGEPMNGLGGPPCGAAAPDHTQ